MAKPKRAPKPFNAPPAVFMYTSSCCNEMAKKPSVLEVSKQTEDKQGTLGKFRCSKCGKRTKVARHIRKEEPKVPIE